LIHLPDPTVPVPVLTHLHMDPDHPVRGTGDRLHRGRLPAEAVKAALAPWAARRPGQPCGPGSVPVYVIARITLLAQADNVAAGSSPAGGEAMSRLRKIAEIPAGSWTKWLVVGFWLVVVVVAYPLQSKLSGVEKAA
jgi:hypothetical protein